MTDRTFGSFTIVLPFVLIYATGTLFEKLVIGYQNALAGKVSFIFFPISNTAILSLVFWQAINKIPVMKQKNILFIFKFN
jgi:hypothetical protein